MNFDIWWLKGCDRSCGTQDGSRTPAVEFHQVHSSCLDVVAAGIKQESFSDNAKFASKQRSKQDNDMSIAFAEQDDMTTQCLQFLLFVHLLGWFVREMNKLWKGFAASCHSQKGSHTSLFTVLLF